MTVAAARLLAHIGHCVSAVDLGIPEPCADVGFTRGMFTLVRCDQGAISCCACCALLHEKCLQQAAAVMEPRLRGDADFGMSPCAACSVVCMIPTIDATSVARVPDAKEYCTDDEEILLHFEQEFGEPYRPTDTRDTSESRLRLTGQLAGMVCSPFGRLCPEVEAHCAAVAKDAEPGSVAMACLACAPAGLLPDPRRVATALSHLQQASDNPYDRMIPTAWLKHTFHGSDLVPEDEGSAQSLVRRVIRARYPAAETPILGYLRSQAVSFDTVDLLLLLVTMRGVRGTAMPSAALAACDPDGLDFSRLRKSADISANFSVQFAQRWNSCGVSPAEVLFAVALAKDSALALEVLQSIEASQKAAAARGSTPLVAARIVEGKAIGLFCAHMIKAPRPPPLHRTKRARRDY